MSAQLAAAAPADATSDPRRDRLAALFDDHEARLYRLARRMTGGADQARDLVQETFFKAALAWQSIPAGAAREEAWLVRVLVNLRRDEWRKTKVRRRAAVVLGTEPASYPSTVESALAAKRAVWAALDVLTPRRRAIVVMHELEGMSHAAVASRLGVSTMTVRWHLSMARRELRPVLTACLGGAR